MGLVRFLPGLLKISYYLSQENHFKKLVSSTGGHLQILLCLTPDDFTRQRETLCGERVKKTISLNPFTTSGHLQILLCLTPDDFTRQRETLGGERVKYIMETLSWVHTRNISHSHTYTLICMSTAIITIPKMHYLLKKQVDTFAPLMA